MWTDERRQRQAENVRKTKAWTRSTGPRSEQGKTRSAMNSTKHGLRGGIFRQAANLLAQGNKLLKELQ